MIDHNILLKKVRFITDPSVDTYLNRKQNKNSKYLYSVG